jgi:hypothetical protein
MLRAEATVAARTAIDGYPERPIPASFRGVASMLLQQDAPDGSGSESGLEGGSEGGMSDDEQ